MKKRKELDALVSNGKIGQSKRNCLKKASGSCSAHELLRHDTDSSDMEDFSILQPRRKGRKKRGNRLCVTSVCLSLCQFILVITSCLISGVAIWLHIGLREDIDLLRAHLQKVEAGNSNTPQLLHGIHNKFQFVDSNMSMLFVEVKKNTADIEHIITEVKLLKDIAQDLKESIAAAPAIQELPKNVHALSESVANFGAKINALESNVKELKDQQSNVQSLTSNLSSDLDSLKNIVQDLANSTDLQSKSGNTSSKSIKLQTTVQETNTYVHNLEGRLLNVVESVDKMNSSLNKHFNIFNDLPSKVDTLNEALELILNTTHSQKTLLHSIQSYIETNVTLRLDQLELDVGHSLKNYPTFTTEYLNRTISDEVLHVLNKQLFHNGNSTDSFKSLEQAHDLLVILGSLLEKNSNSYILNNHNASILMKELLHQSFDDMIASTDSKIQVLEQEVKNLSSCIPVNSDTKSKTSDITTLLPVQASKVSHDPHE